MPSCAAATYIEIARWLIDNSDSMDMDNTASKICCTLECPKINFKGKLMLFQFVGKIGKSHVFLDNRHSSAKQDQNHLLQDREPISKKQFNSRKHYSSQFICFKHTRNQIEEWNQFRAKALLQTILFALSNWKLLKRFSLWIKEYNNKVT